MQVTLTPEHGYAIGVAIASAFFMTSLAVKVGGARRKANIPYPYMYASKEEAEKDPAKHTFNCVQRAHQNTLENYPSFLMLFGIASIETPLYASIAGAVYLLGRYVFACGYSTGVPAARNRGAFQYFGLLTLVGLSIKTAYTLITA